MHVVVLHHASMLRAHLGPGLMVLSRKCYAQVPSFPHTCMQVRDSVNRGPLLLDGEKVGLSLLRELSGPLA